MTTEDRRSRYAGSRRVLVVDAAGDAHELLVPRVVPETPARGRYEIRPGDRLDLLGNAAFGDSTQWWVLADANPQREATALEEPGSIIRLPDE